MTSYQNKPGVWMLYDYETGPYVIRVEDSLVLLVREAAQQAYGRVGFWPFDKTLTEAVDWWEERNQQLVREVTGVSSPEKDVFVGATGRVYPSDKNIFTNKVVHFYYADRTDLPLCKDGPGPMWVQFNHETVGQICLICQDKLGRKIQ